MIADVATDGTLRRYRAALPSLLVVRLTISLDRARLRAGTRPMWLTVQEFEHLHEHQVNSPVAADVVLGVDGLSEQAQYDAVEHLWADAAH